MRQVDALNLLAVHADAEARSTAQLVEMIAVSVAVKLGATEIALSQGDINDAMQGHEYVAGYDEHGTMTLKIERK